MDNSPAAAVNPTVQAEPPSNRSAMLVAFIVVFIDLLGFAIVLPLLPVIAKKYIKEACDAQYVGLVLGLLFAAYSLMQFLFAPLWGRLSDRIGRRPVLLLSLAGAAVFYALLGFACQLPGSMATLAVALLFLARAGAGIAGATIGTSQAVIADSTPPSKRKHGMALIGAAFGIGFTFGPLIGALVLAWFPDRYEVVGYTAAVLSTIAFVVGCVKLPETRKSAADPPVARRSWNVGALIAAAGNASIGPIVLLFFLSTLGFAGFETTLSLFLKDSALFAPGDAAVPPILGASITGLAASPMGNGPLLSVSALIAGKTASANDLPPGMVLVFAYIGFVALLTQGYIYRKLAKRLSEVAFITLGILCMAVGVAVLAVVCYGAFPNIHGPRVELPLMPLLFVALTAAVMGYAFLTPSAQALISRRTSANRQGEVLGVNQSASAMGRILGPLLGLPLYMSTPGHLLPYVLGVVLLTLMLPIIPFIRRGERPEPAGVSDGPSEPEA